MDITNIKQAKEWFEVLQTHKRAQTAMMTLAAGEATGSKPEAHPGSDQILLVLEGRRNGAVGRKRPRLKKSDVIIVPAGVKHRFINPGPKAAVTFNVYTPPAYPAGTKG